MNQEVVGRGSQRRSRCGLLRYRACHAGSALSCTNPHFMYNLFAASLTTVTCTYISVIPHSLATTLDFSMSLYPTPLRCSSFATQTLLKYALAKSTLIPSGFVPAISSGSQRHWLRSRLPTTTLSSIPSENLHAEHKSSEEFDSCDSGRVAFTQDTRVKPSLFPETLSLSASNSRSAKYLL